MHRKKKLEGHTKQREVHMIQQGLEQRVHHNWSVVERVDHNWFVVEYLTEEVHTGYLELVPGLAEQAVHIHFEELKQRVVTILLNG